MGHVEIDPEPFDAPEVGERVAIDADGRYCSWRYIPSGQQVMVRDFAGSGNLNWEVAFHSPASRALMPGVWRVAEDNAGIFFYPAIYFRDGKEIIPEEARIVRAKKFFAPAPAREAASAGDGSFTDIGGRHFKCGCGATIRATKSEWKQYQSGSPIEIYCSACGAQGQATSPK